MELKRYIWKPGIWGIIWNIHVEISWVVMLCSVVVGYQWFRGSWRQHGALKHWYPTAQCHNPENDLNLHYHENLNSHKLKHCLLLNCLRSMLFWCTICHQVHCTLFLFHNNKTPNSGLEHNFPNTGLNLIEDFHKVLWL